jgi:hypothetical protein
MTLVIAFFKGFLALGGFLTLLGCFCRGIDLAGRDDGTEKKHSFVNGACICFAGCIVVGFGLCMLAFLCVWIGQYL